MTFTSVSCVTLPKFLNLLSCNEDTKYLESSRPLDHTTFAFKASLGSALSTIIALKAKIPRPVSSISSLRLYASTRLLLAFCKSLPTPYGNTF